MPRAPNPYRLDEFAKPKPVGTERDEEDSPVLRSVGNSVALLANEQVLVDGMVAEPLGFVVHPYPTP